MKVLFVLFRSLGDVCMGSTVIHALKQNNPDMIIDVMTEKQNVNTLEGNPDVNDIIIGDNYMYANIYFVKNKYDKLFKVNMVNHVETCWHHLPELQNQHLVEWYGKKCGLDKLEDKNIYIFPSVDDEKIANELYSKTNKEKLVAIHTTSGSHKVNGTDFYQRVDSKDWPISYFDVVAERLIRNGYSICQIGADNDKVMQYKNVVNLLGQLTFKQTYSFLKKCSGYIGVDSGPAYLSGQTGIPTLLIMGATQNQSSKYGPGVGPRNDNVTYLNPIRPNDKNCNPVPCYTHCQIKKFGGCIIDITTDQVYEKFKQITGE